MLNCKNDPDLRDAWECLRKYRKHLSRQQCLTLRSQMKSGNVNAAMNGLSTILSRKGL